MLGHLNIDDNLLSGGEYKTGQMERSKSFNKMCQAVINQMTKEQLAH